METKIQLTVLDIPVQGGLIIMCSKTRKVLCAIGSDDPGDIAPDVAVRKVVAMYAVNNHIVVEVE